MSNTSGAESLMEMGSGLFGCSHYRRRCKIRAPCCDEIFDCRHCHNESKVVCSFLWFYINIEITTFGISSNITATAECYCSCGFKIVEMQNEFFSIRNLEQNSLEVDPLNRHDVPRHEVKRVICSLCHTEQDVQQKCIQCGVCMGKYFCSKCKFFDDDVLKDQYHCDKCGICRTGGEENFFHCNKCGCCYSRLMKDSHICVERAMHHNCPVCFEYLFDTTKDMSVLPCGHTIHLQCVKEMERHFQYSCPVCSKSYCDMSRAWLRLDQEVASMPMPEMYENKMVWILCNDCGETSEVNFHIVAHKCVKCNSYNTRRTRGGPASCSSRIEMVR
ncbi:hypothetical protein RHMOL_Rhmol03G0099200 [Rhododendron molle]|uniref:Uncharacterized protein n=2 Tax=Rhododendron molle TaxID=49168 RepID=A0ACC0PDL2_RHOML|nr:hypothetical protein RHMOL_Rhmol03G0099200 [Rhododendron molle]KAI8563264.1 hypothetical protein RHMOL_Rhmol03G0099200 [Rhododendron molle]